MDEQCQSFDGLLQLNQDFCVPDQLFEDSDVGVEDIYNTVEIETSETDMVKDDCVIISSQPAEIISFQPAETISFQPPSSQPPSFQPPSSQPPSFQPPSSQPPSCQLPSTTMKNCINNQDADDDKTIQEASLNQSHLPTSIGTGNQISIPSVMPVVTQTNVPLAVQTTVPLAAPSNHAPLKMVSVPINSDVITQGNSQVVLIPVGGMDSVKLENALKVPEGQKLVIIKPQEILKTIEQKKSQKNSAHNLTQQGILLQGVRPAGIQQVNLIAGHPDNRGLVKLTVPPAAIPQSVSISQNVPHVAVSSNSIRPQLTQSALPQQKLQTTIVNTQVSHSTMVPIQAKAIQVPSLSNQAVKSDTGQPGVAMKIVAETTLQNATVGSKVLAVQPKISTSITNNKEIAHLIGQTRGPMSNTSQASQNSKPSNQLGNTTLADQTTSQSILTTTQTSVSTSQTSLTTSQTSVSPSQASLTTSQTSVTTFKTSVTTSQTGLTTSQTSVSTSQTGSTTSQSSFVTSKSGLPAQNTRLDATPNVYQTLKQKFREETSGQNLSNTASGNKTETLNAKPVKNMQSSAQTTPPCTESEKVQSNAAVTKPSAEKVGVTFVSPDKSEKIVSKEIVTTDQRTGAYILGPSKSEGHERGTVNETISKLAGGQQPANGQEAASQPQSANPKIVPKIVPRIIPRIIPKIASSVSKTKNSEIKGEESSIRPVTNSDDAPSTSKAVDQSSTEVRKRGRPRKDESVSTVSGVDTEQGVMKPLSGPTVKHELDRHSPGKAKTSKQNEPQIKIVKHKRVSSTNPWTCALCGKVSFANSLGCLYGPYDGEVKKEGRAVEDREEGEPYAKKRRGSNGDEVEQELWFHGDCIVWSPGVYALGDTLAGYHQVVADARSRNCDYCGNTGATLVCLQRTCKKQFHFFCAKKTGCVFDESNYTIQCRKHVK